MSFLSAPERLAREIGIETLRSMPRIMEKPKLTRAFAPRQPRQRKERRTVAREILLEICHEETQDVIWTIKDVRGPSRHAELVKVRHTVILRAIGRGLVKLDIARFMKMDHTSINHVARSAKKSYSL